MPGRPPPAGRPPVRPGAPPPSRPAGGRGGRSPAGAPGAGLGRRPMPWVEEKGLLPGRGAPGRAPPDADRACSPRRASGPAAGLGRLPRASSCPAAGCSVRSGLRRSDGLSLLRGSGLLGGGRLLLGRTRAGLRGARTLGRSLRGQRRSGSPPAAGAASAAGSRREPATGRSGLLGRPLRGGLRLGGGAELRAVLVGETLLDGGFDRRRRRLDELSHLLELGQNDLALDSELFGELVDSDLSHAFPPGPSRKTVSDL